MKLFVTSIKNGEKVSISIPNIARILLCKDSGEPIKEMDSMGNTHKPVKPETGFEHNIYGIRRKTEYKDGKKINT